MLLFYIMHYSRVCDHKEKIQYFMPTLHQVALDILAPKISTDDQASGISLKLFTFQANRRGRPVGPGCGAARGLPRLRCRGCRAGRQNREPGLLISYYFTYTKSDNFIYLYLYENVVFRISIMDLLCLICGVSLSSVDFCACLSH